MRRLPASAEPCPFWSEPLLPPESAAPGGDAATAAGLLAVPAAQAVPSVLAVPGGTSGAERGLAWAPVGGELVGGATDDLQPGLYCIDANMLQAAD